MAIYGVDLYGLSTYGLASTVQFDASPFVAASVDYDKVLITWTNPAGSWTELRLIKNLQGYPVHENDGQILLDTSGPTRGFTDFSVNPGRFQYYGIYVLSGGSWIRAGVTSCLVTQNWGSAGWLLEHLPRFYTYNTPTDSATENTQFTSFIKVFGWALDYLRTSYDVLQYLNDPARTHLSNVITLARQLGINVDSDTSGHLLRQQVANAAHLDRRHGTLAGLASSIALVTGWGADVQISGNMLLDDDQSSFLNPLFPGWDPSMNYAAGEQVTYNGYLYQANTGGAYGTAPSGTGTSNASWLIVQDITTSAYLANSKTGNLSTWQALSYTPSVGSAQIGIYLGTGVQSATDGSVNYANALAVINNSTPALTADVGLRSVSGLAGQPSTSMDPLQPIGDGIPLPVVYNTWAPTVTYDTGALVMWNGRPWQALRESTGTQPPDAWRTPTPEWTAIGADTRIRYMLSGYTHVPITASGATTAPVIPFVEWYDYQGNLIAHVDSRAVGHMASDSFTDAPATSTQAINTNPGFETTDMSGWSSGFGGTLVRSTDFAHTGTYSAKFTPNGTTTNPVAGGNSAGAPAVTAGNGYQATAWVYCPVAYSTVYVDISWLDSNGSVLSDSGGFHTSLPAGVWTPLSVAGIAPAGAVKATPKVFILGTPPATTLFYIDELSLRPDTFITRAFEYGTTYTWSTPTGAWVRDGYQGGTARPAVPGARSVALVTGDADCQVAVTMRTAQASGQVQGIVFRYSDDSNYWRATRSAIVKRVSGTLTSVGTYSTPIADGDRLTVKMQGSAITVYRNGVQVYTATDSFNSTATKHGMLVE